MILCDVIATPVLSSGFAESSTETTYFAPYPTEEPDFIDDYGYSSDSDLDDDSEALYDDWEVETPQPPSTQEDAKTRTASPSETLAPDTTDAGDVTIQSPPTLSNDNVPNGSTRTSENSQSSDFGFSASITEDGHVALHHLGPPCRQIIIKDTAFLTCVSNSGLNQTNFVLKCP